MGCKAPFKLAIAQKLTYAPCGIKPPPNPAGSLYYIVFIYYLIFNIFIILIYFISFISNREKPSF
ncbi:MAG: hypothetical protein DSY59_00210 [Persephonella sp.]|nr:MAG: hypothetical protein DSY60_04280 [Persephonella sp.]RUM62444.1 MAG: hypothetical protein DSY59_00210 [Persephonella sp.]